MSSWLQKNILPSYPNVEVFDVIRASNGMQASAAYCASWSSQCGLTHPVLRDKATADSIKALLNLPNLTLAMVVDRQMKIVFRGWIDTTSGQQALLSVVKTLK